MARKKKEITPKHSQKTLSEALGVDKILAFFKHEYISFGIGILLLGVSIFMILSFVSFFTSGGADVSRIEHPQAGEFINSNNEYQNYCGSAGAYCAYFFIKDSFGLASFIIPILLLLVAFKIMRIYQIKLGRVFIFLSLFMVWSSIAMAKMLTILFGNSFFNPGGEHGVYIMNYVENIIGEPGLLISLAITAVFFLIYLSKRTIELIRNLFHPISYISNKFKRKDIDNEDVLDEQTEDIDEQENNDEEEIEKVDEPEDIDIDNEEIIEEEIEEEIEEPTEESSFVTDNVTLDDEEPIIPEPEDDNIDMEIDLGVKEEKAEGDNLVKIGDKDLMPYDPKLDLQNYHYPTLDLLKKYDTNGQPNIDKDELNANKERIVEVLRNFGVEISSIIATVGPTITLYEITPAAGIRISKIRNLEDDIALSLSALGIRIIAPIPGKGTIGIEVPNTKPSIVSMESILNSKKFQDTTMDLPCAIGKTITNEVYMFDLAKAPHLLVAGATGQGKSVGLNAIITSLLYKKHPAEMKIVLVDPKKVEFSVYANIDKHFLAKVPDDDAEPIITDVTKVVRTLNSLCKEMDTRYDLLKTAQVRNIKEYNKKFCERKLNPDKGHRFLPYIVVVIDEFGDLIMTAGKEVELPIARIAQLARAVGIHMIIATQRPTTNIITGTIKANFPSRIAFRVGAMIDSRTILDRPGAQQLVGRGDMLYLNGGEPVRVQCAFVDTPEVDRINQYISEQQGYPYTFELPEPDMPDSEGGSSANDVDMQHLDPLFEDAARLIMSTQSGSTSLIQRKFSIGFNRAGRLMDQLEKAGIVGTANGSKPREVMIQDENSLNNLLSALRQ